MVPGSVRSEVCPSSSLDARLALTQMHCTQASEAPELDLEQQGKKLAIKGFSLPAVLPSLPGFLSSLSRLQQQHAGLFSFFGPNLLRPIRFPRIADVNLPGVTQQPCTGHRRWCCC